MQLGNGKWETGAYNNRLQVTQIGLGTTDAQQNLLKLEYTYNTTGNTDNNGSLLSQKISFDGLEQPFEQTYTYDSLNRLQSAEEKVNTQKTWKQTFSIDRYGNRRFNTDNNNTTTLGSCSTAVCNPTISTSNNRFSSGQGYSYDANGSVTQDAEGKRFGYDAENRQKEFFATGNNGSTPDATYSYDGAAKRIKKISPTETTVFVYDGGGPLVAEYSTQISQTPQVSYLTADHLGSPRITTDKNGTVFSRRDFLPFGEEIKSTQTSQRNINLNYGEDGLRQKFTGYERDIETDLDFAQARYYAKSHGRFTGVDPYNIIFKKKAGKNSKEQQELLNSYIANPQVWNRYSYVLNSPVNNIDKTGNCTAPTGLQKGQVGICIEAFIKTAKVQGSSIGNGDGRDFNGNNPNLTNRVQVQFVLTSSNGVVSADMTKVPGRSELGFGVKAAGLPVVSEIKVGFQGTAHVDYNYQYNNLKGEGDFGTTTLNVSGSARNGVSNTADLLILSGGGTALIGAAINAVAPVGNIQFNMNFTVSGSGNVNLTGLEVSGYPSFGIYSYTVDANGNTQSETLKQVPEGNIDELNQPMKKVL